MPRGSKAGERRGGRQKGTPNKRTVFNNAIAAAAAADPDVLPLDLFLNVMRDPKLPLDTRIMAAQSASPYVHARPIGHGQPPGPGLSRVKTKPVGPDASDDLEIKPLNFLLRVMRDPETPSHCRMRVGSIVARYIHRKVEPRQPTQADLAVDDQYGFVVDWAKGKALRDMHDTLERLPQIWHMSGGRGSFAEQRDKLLAAIAENTKGLECPPGYRWADRYKDQERFSSLGRKRRAKGRLTAEEETEEIYLAARIASHANSEEGRAARGSCVYGPGGPIEDHELSRAIDEFRRLIHERS